MLPPSDSSDLPPSPSSNEPFVPDMSEGAEVGVYLALLELIDEGLIITGDETIIDANSTACRLLEREYREVAGRPLAELFPSEQAFLKARERLLIQGEMRGSLRIALPGGRHRDFRFIAAARLRPGIHALILSPDFLAEVEPQPKYQVQDDSLWPRLAAALAQPVIVVDGTGRIVAANAAAFEILDLTHGKMIGHSVTECLGMEWPREGGAVVQLQPPGQGTKLTARVLSKPRTDWCLLVLPPFLAGHYAGQSINVFDLFQRSKQATVVYNADREAIYVNPAFAALMGYPFSELKGKTIDILFPSHLPVFMTEKQWERVEENGQWQAQCWCQHKNGKVLPVWLNIAAVEQHRSKAEFYIVTLSDCMVQRWVESSDRHFSEMDSEDITRRGKGWFVRLERELPLAIEKKQLEIYLQPLVDVRDGKACRGEALLRWHHPHYGLIPFRRFIGAARDSGLIADLGDWALADACRIAASWMRCAGKAFVLTVNVAVEQVMQEDFLECVQKALTSSGLSPAMLEFDLDERILQEDPGYIGNLLEKIDGMGICLALDDFGRGPSALAKLGCYPIKAIKLDPFLVRDIGKNGGSSEMMIEAIMHLAVPLGLKVFARGVRSEGQQAFLSALGCYFQQGPLFGPPLDAEEFTARFVCL